MLNATVIFLDYFSVEMVVRVCVRSNAKKCELRSVELRSSSFHSVVCIGCYCSLSGPWACLAVAFFHLSPPAAHKAAEWRV